MTSYPSIAACRAVHGSISVVATRAPCPRSECARPLPTSPSPQITATFRAIMTARAHVSPSRAEQRGVGAGRDEPAQLLVDDLGEALRHVDDALVELARVDPRAERERAGAGGLGVSRRVAPEVLELLDDPEPARGRLDAADRFVARLLVVTPRARLAA